MLFLKTKDGLLSSRWIVKIQKRSDAEYWVAYTYGHGAFDTTASAANVEEFLALLGHPA